MKILGLGLEIQPCRFKLILTLDLAIPASLRLEMYCLGVLGKMPSRAKESKKKVLHVALKMAILGPCFEIQPGKLKYILILDAAATTAHL